MCTNQREIVNKYTGHKLYVKCGKCPACLQEKAAFRVTRIKSQDSPELECVLVGLTYRRHDAPYVYRDSAYKFSKGLLVDDKGNYKPLNVWRDNNYRKIRISSDYKIGYRNTGPKLLCQIDPVFVDFNGKQVAGTVDFSGNKDLRYLDGKIGICYYPDVQDFMARLRQNLKRKYNITEWYGNTKSLSAYCCSEYGTKTLRPHFHLLLWIPKGTFEIFRSAIIESWPYGDLQKFERAVEKAFRAATYVASYVNCKSDFPQFLKTYFKPKHSYSKGFGCNNHFFVLRSILERYNRGNLNLFVQKTINGYPSVVELPTPQYVISRYFPLFKGYNRLTPATALFTMQRLARFNYAEKDELTLMGANTACIHELTKEVHLSRQDMYKISVRLTNAYKRFCACAPADYDGFSLDDYLRLHLKVWSLYHANVLRLSMTNPDIPLEEKYDNLEEIKVRCFPDRTLWNFEIVRGKPYTMVITNVQPRPVPIGFTKDMFRVTDPNKFQSVLVITRRYAQSYAEHIKHRSVSNAVLSSQYVEF